MNAMSSTPPAAIPAEKVHLEDYRVGEVFQSQARTLTEADVVHYSMFSGDWDRQVGDDGVWLVPDMFTFSLGLCLLLGAGRYAWMAKSFIAFYGFDTIEIQRQASLGDTISSQVTVTDLVVRDETRGVVVFRHETVDQHGQLVCSSLHRALLGRRPSVERAA
jgi:acyl dehydratase